MGMESGQAIPAVAGHVLASAVSDFRFRSDPVGSEEIGLTSTRFPEESMRGAPDKGRGPAIADGNLAKD